jgi:hypothetical protein
MQHFDPPRPVPILPNLRVSGINAESCTIFQSAMCPIKLDFFTVSRGDDELARKSVANNP